ncbi:hypothetical protein GCK32_012873 [Trichostrongylus colubriformis]
MIILKILLVLLFACFEIRGQMLYGPMGPPFMGPMMMRPPIMGPMMMPYPYMYNPVRGAIRGAVIGGLLGGLAATPY